MKTLANISLCDGTNSSICFVHIFYVDSVDLYLSFPQSFEKSAIKVNALADLKTLFSFKFSTQHAVKCKRAAGVIH